MLGMFDSGVGGLSVYQSFKKLRPTEPVIYLADQAFAPYGLKTLEELQDRTKQVVQFLLDRGAYAVLIACNTATLAAIDSLRHAFPKIQFIGMEPAVRPAAQVADKIIVLGTNSTVANHKYRELCDRVAPGKTIWHIGAPKLVWQVEQADLTNSQELEWLLAEPIKHGAEALVIGCTHFSFLTPLIHERWPDLKIFDGKNAAVEQASELLGTPSSPDTKDHFFTTGTDRIIDFITPAITFEHLEIS